MLDRKRKRHYVQIQKQTCKLIVTNNGNIINTKREKADTRPFSTDVNAFISSTSACNAHAQEFGSKVSSYL